MNLRIGVLVSCAGLLGQTTVVAALAELSLVERDRVLVLAPHPDDEVLGCGGVIQEALAKGIPARVVFLTYGDHNEWSFLVYRKHPVVEPGALRRMGLVRHDEAVAAGQVLGLASNQLTFLGYPDLGTLPIWTSHWNDDPAFRSLLTDTAQVPYTNALRPGASYRGEEILRDLESVIRDFRPTKVFVSHPMDHHPDHRALYLFATVALWNLRNELKPELLPYLIHHKDWPRPKGMHGALPLEPPPSLREHIVWKRDELAPQIVERNDLALRQHRTQYDYSAQRLLALLRANELFGDFPAVPLTGRTSFGSIQEPPEQLTDRERATLLAVEECHAALEDGRLSLSITHSRGLIEALELSVFAFGYRADRSFGEMPKLHLKVSALEHEAYEGSKRLPRESVAIQRGSREITFGIPLELLGNPDRILTTARTHVGDLPVDWTAWRILE
ncbi:MAG TPA: PIG-L family deacetylase [Verrucomicrobiae bacterium]|nr:PIG-L family deacetylase [Verrucomicrobiae bacterium]